MTTFIYQPLSGNRVFVEAPVGSIRSWCWPNGSRHVIGGYRLVVRPQGRRDERSDMTKMLTVLIQRFGGVGWDEQGCLTILTTAEGVTALQGLKKQMQVAQRLQEQESSLADLEAQMALQGAASPCWNADGLLTWLLHPTAQEDIVVNEVSLDVEKTHIRTNLGNITVPTSWASELESTEKVTEGGSEYPSEA